MVAHGLVVPWSATAGEKAGTPSDDVTKAFIADELKTNLKGIIWPDGKRFDVERCVPRFRPDGLGISCVAWLLPSSGPDERNFDVDFGFRDAKARSDPRMASVADLFCSNGAACIETQSRKVAVVGFEMVSPQRASKLVSAINHLVELRIREIGPAPKEPF